MKRIWGYVVSLVAAGTVVGAALPACATNDQTIFIRSALAPSTTRVGGSCTYTSDTQQPGLLEPLVDVGLTDSYFAVFLIGNQLITRGDPQNNRAESNRAHINGGVVRVTEPDGRLIREFTSLAAGFNDPSNNNTPGYGVSGLTVFDPGTADIVCGRDAPDKPCVALPNRGTSKTVLINVKVFGTTLGGVDVESGEYQMPMQVCNGCLVKFDGYDTGVDPLKPAPDNCNLPAEKTAGTDGPCRVGQDVPISCRTCQGLPICDPNVK